MRSLLSAILFGSIVQATTFNVPTDAYPTIQAAVTAAASSGETIQVAAGIYVENVYVDKSLTIVGAGAATTIVDGNATGSVLKVFGDIDVVVSGLLKVTVQQKADLRT